MIIWCDVFTHMIKDNRYHMQSNYTINKQNITVILCDAPFAQETNYMSMVSDIIGKDNICPSMTYKLAYIDENQKCLSIMMEMGNIFTYSIPTELHNMIKYEKPTVTALMGYLIEKEHTIVYTVIDSDHKVYKYAPQR